MFDMYIAGLNSITDMWVRMYVPMYTQQRLLHEACHTKLSDLSHYKHDETSQPVACICIFSPSGSYNIYCVTGCQRSTTGFHIDCLPLHYVSLGDSSPEQTRFSSVVSGR